MRSLIYAIGIVACLCSGVFSMALCAQSAKLDSMIQALETSVEDTSKVIALRDISIILRKSDLNEAVRYGEASFDLAQKLDYKDGAWQALNLLGVINRRLGNREAALDFGKQSLALGKELKKQGYIATAYNSVGTIYRIQGEYDDAVECFLAAARIYEQEDEPFGKGVSFNNIGLIFKKQSKYEQAAKYYEKSLAGFMAAKEEPGAKVTNALANVYMNLGNVTDSDSLAFQYLQKSLELFTEQNNKSGIASTNINLGSIYLSQGLPEKALSYYEDALASSLEVGRTSRILRARSAIAKILLEKGQPETALSHALEALELAKSSQDLSEEDDTEIILARIYKNMGNYKKANEHLENHFVLRDSLFNVEKLTLSNELEAKYQSSKTEAELAATQLEAEKEKNLRNMILLGAIALLVLGLFIAQLMLGRHRKKQQATQLALTLKEQEAQQLKDLDELKSSFFTNISHELRTPLTLVLSPLQDVIEKNPSMPDINRLQLVQKNANNLLNLVNEIMDLSKIEAGKLELQYTPTELPATVDRIFAAFESMADIQRIDFQIDNRLPDHNVRLDADKFEKILNNLLHNALKFTPTDGKVTLTTTATDGVYHFEVKDSGEAIATEDLPRIFDRFYQAKKGKQQQGGTGIGLALSRELAQMMGGSLTAASTPSVGNTFRLSLPLEAVAEKVSTPVLSEETSPEPAVSSYVPLSIQGQKPRILIVEDNKDMGAYLVDILGEHYQCTLATDGLEAIQQLRQSTFDCITSDVMMPNMDGFELRERINEEAGWRSIPFLLLTARHLEQDKVYGFQLGIDDYITKPFNTKELKARIRNLIQNKIARDTEVSEAAERPAAEQLSADEQWLRGAEAFVLKNIDNPQFSVDDLARHVGYSSKQLGRLIKRQTGLTTVNFILEIRLQKARDLLEQKAISTVTAAQLEVGISSMSYFTRKFTERFGKNPKEVLASG